MSTAKILFGSFLAICIVGMFLLFSMQKSAQLSLDMGNMQLISNEKDNKIASIKDVLQSAQATIEQVQIENAQISELKNNIETVEKEKLVYVQQLDDFQAELQNQVDIGKQRFSEIVLLQEQQNTDNQLLTALQAEQTELTTALEATLLDLVARTETGQELTATLVKKDRVIQIYKDKLDIAADEIALLQTGDTNEQLNLVLILDELAQKTALAKDLGHKLAIANNEAIASGTDTSVTVAINSENQALVEKLSLENDYLGTGIKALNVIIEELVIKQAAGEELLASFTAEIEQLQFLVADKDKEITGLQLQVDGSTQQIDQLTATITAREEEVIAVKKQTQGIATPLTEKITGLELQITQATGKFTNLSEELNQSQSALGTMGEEKQVVSDELASAKVALESMQTKFGEAETNQATLQESITTLEQQLTSKEESIVTMTAALAAATSLAADNETFAAGLSEQLAVSKNESTDHEERISKLIEEVATVQALSIELSEKINNLQARNEELLAALAAKDEAKVNEAVEPESVIEEETRVSPETEAVEIIAVEEVPEIVVVVDEVIVVEELAQDEPAIVIAEEVTVTGELVPVDTVIDEAQSLTEPTTEQIPLQDDSPNTENL